MSKAKVSAADVDWTTYELPLDARFI